ncbi:unnamed protein product [Tuber aestivum]|uniref:Uncharacterized protein n=1 Tax=Tuber aestivum TaxID=59557 RepID=A0A292PVF7_9PEZI|nr:unnamed protein product [Tuber aestivum]
MKLKTSSTAFEKPIRHQSLDELYRELDAIHWGWKLVASCANWMMLAGFVVLPSAFDDDDSKFRIDSNVLRISAVALLLTGYLVTGILCYTFKNLLFQVEAIFIPGLTGSALGMLSTLFNVYGKKYEPGEKRWSGTAISAVVLSAVFILFYGAAALTGQRRIDLIRQRDLNVSVLREELENPDLIPEEEHMRRQLLTLLMAPSQNPGKLLVPNTGFDSSAETSRSASVDRSRGPSRDYNSDHSRGHSGNPSYEIRPSPTPRPSHDMGIRRESAIGDGGGLGLPSSLRLEQEFRRSGVVMKATLGHDEEISGDYCPEHYGL